MNINEVALTSAWPMNSPGFSQLSNGRDSSLVPRLLPYRKTGREPGRTDHVPSDVLCVVLCVVLIIELLPTRSVVVCR